MNQECHMLFQLYNAFCFPYIIRKTSATTETLYRKKEDLRSFPIIFILRNNHCIPPLPPFKSFYSSFILFFPSFLLKVIFTVWSRLESPQQSVLDKVGTSLRHEPTRLHILNKCTCAHICTQKQKEGKRGDTKKSVL